VETVKLSKVNFKIMSTKEYGDLLVIDCLPYYKAENTKEAKANLKRMNEIIDVYLERKKPFWKR